MAYMKAFSPMCGYNQSTFLNRYVRLDESPVRLALTLELNPTWALSI